MECIEPDEIASLVQKVSKRTLQACVRTDVLDIFDSEMDEEVLGYYCFYAGEKLGSPELFRKAMEYFLDAGEDERAYMALEKGIDVGSEVMQDYIELGNWYIENGRPDDAARIFSQGLQKFNKPIFRSLLRKLPKVIEEGTEDTYEAHELVRFLQYFEGREGVHAEMWVDGKGRVGYRPVREPLSPALLRRHLQGDITLGVYPVRLDNTVRFIAIDIDINRSILESHSKNPDELEPYFRKIHELGMTIRRWLTSRGIPCALEDSGYKGRHIWIFFHQPFPARIARQIGLALTRQFPPPKGIHYDVFPRQDFLEPDQLGNLIKIPLGYHRKTGRRCVFLDEKGHPYKDGLRWLLRLKRLTPETIRELGKSLVHSVPAQTPGHEEEVEIPSSRVEAIAVQASRPSYHPETDPEFMILMTYCSVLRHLFQKARRESFLNYDEQLTIVHTIGHLTYGVEAVHYIFDHCVNAHDQLRLKSRLRGNPMSCPKIRKRIPDITSIVTCACTFDPELGYPTPLLHLRLHERTEPDVWKNMQRERLSEAYIRLARELESMKQELEFIRNQLIEDALHSGEYTWTCEHFELAVNPETRELTFRPISQKENEKTSREDV